MTADSVPETRMPFAALAGVIASVTVFGVAQVLSNPLFTFLMQYTSWLPAPVMTAMDLPVGFQLHLLKASSVRSEK